MTLQEMRIEKGLTQKQASRILGITTTYLSMLENKLRNPSDKLKKEMAKLYGVSITDIFLNI